MQEHDFTFAFEGASEAAGAFGHLLVVEFSGEERMSALYRYELTLLARAPAPPVDPHDLILARGTLRIATGSSPAFKVVHGVVTEAEELGQTGDGVLYRVILMPPVARAAFRMRCRIFLEKTIREIVDAVLTGDPNLRREDGATVKDDPGSGSYAAAAERFAWRIADAARIDDVAVRPYVVQYNESDLAFVSRLLEDEGIAYHFENGEEACLLVLSDSDVGRARLAPFEPLGPRAAGREITAVRLGARARAKHVRLDDYNYRQPAVDLLVEASEAGAGGPQSDLVDFQYPGGFPDTPEQGRRLAALRLDRFRVEARYATMDGHARVLSAGTIFALEHQEARYEGEYLVTALRARGQQRGILAPEAGSREVPPLAVSIECARRGAANAASESRFRPALATPRPRIHGAQTAFVTADPSAPGAEINVDGHLGCVRLKFHWDNDAERLAREPSSSWVRVNQVFAGVGEGGVFHPRVGVECIVEFEGGDPDRPIVVGRVYNGQNLPPTTGATESTLRSYASPGGGVYNEIGFNDTAGGEALSMHAGRDMNQNVGNNRSETVANDASSSAGGNRNESTGASRSSAVGANNSEVVGANDSRAVGANQSTAVGANQDTSVGANQSSSVGADQTNSIGANQTTSVGGSSQTMVGGTHDLVVGGARSAQIGGADAMSVAASQSIDVGASQSMSAGASQTFQSPVQSFQCVVHGITAGATFQASAGGMAGVAAPMTVADGQAILMLRGGALTLVTAATVNIQGGGSVVIQGGTVSVEGGAIDMAGGTVNVSGGEVAVQSGNVSIAAGGMVDVQAGLVKLN